MTKYTPLREMLDRAVTTELPVSFAELEQVLGFPLPPSARRHSAWWSNNVGTHVAVRVWRDAGWRTSKVDLGGERVTFVREATPPGPKPTGQALVIPLSALTGAAMKMVEQEAGAIGGDQAQAAANILNQTGRRRLLDEIAARAAQSEIDSVALIREARDQRDARLGS